MLDENPSFAERGQACYWLAHHLRQQAQMVRKLREKPEEMKDYEDYTAAQPIAQFVPKKTRMPSTKKSEALLERVVAEFGDVKADGDTRTLGVIASGELFSRRNLKVGKAAPEIDGTDHEGKAIQAERLPRQGRRAVVLGQLVRPMRGDVPSGARAGRESQGQAVRSRERQHRQGCCHAQGVDQFRRDHLALLVRRRHRRPDHDPVGRRLVSFDLCARRAGVIRFKRRARR